jgi:RNA polymerase sigma-70 factor (ECF subfamily)
MGGMRKGFPSTQWTILEALRESDREEYRRLVGKIAQTYWKPIYCYIRSKGRGREDAKDLTQRFLIDWIEQNKFQGADRQKGRFRSYLLRSLQNFLHNEHRFEKASVRHPRGGIFSLDELIRDEDLAFDPPDEKVMTPEDVFNQTWLQELLRQTLQAFDEECKATGKEVHIQVFHRCIVEPILHGADRPPRSELAREFGLTEKEVSYRLLTARRAFMRLLREEIRARVFSEQDVALETRDVFDYLTSS